MNVKQNIEGTLIHEVQHAIQQIEGFKGRTSTQKGYWQYLKNPGENEARNTAQRFIEEKYNNKDLSNVLPESAKINQNIIEKMKEGLYNYFNKLNSEVNYEEDVEIGETKNNESLEKNRPLVVDGITSKNGNNKTLYDITQIKRISQNHSTSDKSFSASLTNSNNSIPNSKEKSNTNIKYSIQKKEKNTQNSEKVFFPLQDNKGKKLSAEQQEYFKDRLYHIKI